MQLLITVLIILIGIEHIGIMLLEMFGSSEKQAQAFDMQLEFVHQPSAKVALGNQGIYNGALGVILILAIFLFVGTAQTMVLTLLLGYIIVVAIYGGFTATKKIFIIQLLPAVIAMALLWLV